MNAGGGGGMVVEVVGPGTVVDDEGVDSVVVVWASAAVGIRRPSATEPAATSRATNCGPT